MIRRSCERLTSLSTPPRPPAGVNSAIVSVLEEVTGITAPRWDAANASYAYAAWNMPW